MLLKLGVMIVPTNWKNCLTFGDAPIPDTDSGSLFHFPHYCATKDFIRFISTSHTVTGRFTILGEMTDAGKKMNPQHFESDPADIRIRVNPEIWIRIRITFGRR